MDLHTGKSNWIDSLPYIPSYPALEQDATCDVLVVGAGECGALCAFELVSRGLDVIVVDKRKAVSGISSANTGMLQAASDKSLYSYINSLGPERGVRVYQLCRQAIDHLERISSMLELDCQFKRRDSLYFASCEEDVPGLQKEYETLAKYGFDTTYWDESAIGDRFSFRKPAALYSRNDAEFNPYRFVNALLMYISRLGARIFEHTEVIRHSTDKEGIVFYTPHHRIRARYAVIAAGYEAQEWKRNPNAVMSSTFAIATQRLDDFPGWPGRCLIWETARPYLYIRTTADNRIVAGGLDERTSSGTERDRMLRHKSDL
ncbi:MAG: amino acid oxidase, partial [Paenibacillus sp.]|nr:amino acid oxidase [Paenibacillus sp.]